MSNITEAEAPQLTANLSSPAADAAPLTSNTTPQSLAALDPQAQHAQLAQLLTNPEWEPESTREEETSAGAEPRETIRISGGGVGDEISAGAGSGEEGEENAPEGEHAAPEAGPESRDKGKRFRFSDPADQQFAALRKEGVAPDDAARIAYGIGAAPAATPIAPKGEMAAGAADPLAAWEQQLHEVDSRLARAGASEGLINPGIVALFQKRSELVAEIRTETRFQEREAQAQAAREAEAVAKARASQNEAIVAVAERFPHLSAPGTALREEADRLLRLYRGSAFLDDPNAPFTLVEMAATNVARAQSAAHGTSFAAELGKLDQSIAAPKAGATPPRTAIRKITPASGAQATRRPDQPAPDADPFREAQATLDPRAQHEALNRLLYGG